MRKCVRQRYRCVVELWSYSWQDAEVGPCAGCSSSPPVLGGLLAGGGLQKILAGLQQQGLGAQANSWVGTGANAPVTGDQVAKVLGDQEIAQIAQQLGVSNEEAAGELAQVLPQVVDKASPDGQLRSPGELEPAFEELQRIQVPEQ